MTSTPQPLIGKQMPTDVTGVVSSETGFDSARLAAYCSSVKGLELVIEPLEQIHTSAEQVSWCK
ncbi:hypothetical protein FRC00_013774 [Tulasnella sp. 408]|nr:hypothetical protein FRC00_013774 [Tulasnella sp. 408]